MPARLVHFWRDDSGATTVDWVVLTGAVIGLTLAVLHSMNGGTSSIATNIGTVLASVNIAELGDLQSSVAAN